MLKKSQRTDSASKHELNMESQSETKQTHLDGQRGTSIFAAIRRPCVAGYTACERLPSLHAFPPSLFSLCCLSRILFCTSPVSREGPGVGTPDILVDPLVDPSWTPRRPPPLAASACAADLRPSSACALDLVPQPTFLASQGTLSAPFGTSFFVTFGDVFVTFWGVGFETRFLHRFGNPNVVQNRSFSGVPKCLKCGK